MQLPKTEEFIETTSILTTRNNKFEDPEKLENAKITTRRQESNHGTEQCCCCLGWWRSVPDQCFISLSSRSSCMRLSSNIGHVLVLCFVVICGLDLREYRFCDRSSRSLYQPTLTTLFRLPFVEKYPTGRCLCGDSELCVQDCILLHRSSAALSSVVHHVAHHIIIL